MLINCSWEDWQDRDRTMIEGENPKTLNLVRNNYLRLDQQTPSRWIFFVIKSFVQRCTLHHNESFFKSKRYKKKR